MLYTVLKHNPTDGTWESELETYDEAEAVRRHKELKEQGYNAIIDYDNE